MLDLSDDELDDKLEEFKGPISTVDEKTKQQLGVLIDPNAGSVFPDDEAYSQLYNLAGGSV